MRCTEANFACGAMTEGVFKPWNTQNTRNTLNEVTQSSLTQRPQRAQRSYPEPVWESEGVGL